MEQIITGWRRFESGLWRTGEGDIDAAYSADKLSSVTTFTHNGRLYTNCGISGSVARHKADCYLLVPSEDYLGTREKVPYSHEGQEVKLRGKPFIVRILTLLRISSFPEFLPMMVVAGFLQSAEIAQPPLGPKLSRSFESTLALTTGRFDCS